MVWPLPWLSSGNSDFNLDYKVSFTAKEIAEKKVDYNYTIQDKRLSELPGLSVFATDAAEKIFHTYSPYARGIDLMNTAHNYPDSAPTARDEGNPAPDGLR